MIPDYFKCTKCGLKIRYEEASEMECGQCVFDDWIGVTKTNETKYEKREETTNKQWVHIDLQTRSSASDKNWSMARICL